MSRKLWCAGILALVMIASAGCGQKPTTAPESGQQETVSGEQQTTGSGSETAPENNAGNDDKGSAEGTVQDDSSKGSSTDSSSQTTESTAKKEMIDVYYTDPQELDLKKSQKEISYKNEVGKYEEAFKALQSSGKSELVPLWGKIELKKLDFKNGEITMDIHMPDEARLGAGGEQYALDALTKTMFQFDEVKTVELLVDGAKVESLMGHVDLEHPLTRH
ncbi:GerMN domain-containing protein [Paenibacillus dokdonensis]|uniref:GerMN domain-containing protein n=1 Tax=Paenibacillus dokdonensis TaxID=2567944 RepID=A0ABU6GU44_9BACL|nr:GerMN domain-containing protein [Paenibacillus dokdonensis]MEC0243216.1 GerMN domain-containing protein [Paenibacillus dokdonensis]